MALWMGETANFPGQFTAQIPKCTNSRTFHGRERPVSNSRTFPVFPVVWEPCLMHGLQPPLLAASSSH